MLYRASFVSTRATEECVNTIHFADHASQWTGLTSSPTPAAVADELATHLVAGYRTILLNEWTFDRIDVVTVPDPLDPNAAATGGSHHVGLAGTRTGTDDELPIAVCGVAKLTTAKLGRSYRGRLFLPPIMDTQALDNGQIKATSAYLSAAQGWCNDILGSMGGGSAWSTLWIDTWHLVPVVYSRTRAMRGLSPAWESVTSITVPRGVHWLSSRTG